MLVNNLETRYTGILYTNLGEYFGRYIGIVIQILVINLETRYNGILYKNLVEYVGKRYTSILYTNIKFTEC